MMMTFRVLQKHIPPHHRLIQTPLIGGSASNLPGFKVGVKYECVLSEEHEVDQDHHSPEYTKHDEVKMVIPRVGGKGKEE